MTPNSLLAARAMLLLLWGSLSCSRVTNASNSTDIPGSVASAVVRCTALATTDFSGIDDAPTRVTKSALVAANGNQPAFCRVEGYVAGRIGLEIRLPALGWNGKFIEAGCGGWCGLILGVRCTTALPRGYACVVSDMGHRGSPDDIDWAAGNLAAQIDFAYRATHLAALAGKAVTATFYGRIPDRSYFIGCSTGGYQGLMEAQRFPRTFRESSPERRTSMKQPQMCAPHGTCGPSWMSPAGL